MRINTFTFGVSLMGALLLMISWAQPVGADAFPFVQKSAQEQAFIPVDFSAAPGETGEIVLKAGNSYPVFATDDTIGLSFDISWDANKVEFMGAVLDGTVFDQNFELSVSHLASRNVAQIIIWTAESNGAIVHAGDDMAKILFKIKEHAILGDQLEFPLENVEIAYDVDAPRSQILNSIQNGALTVGNKSGPNVFPQRQGEFYFEDNILAMPGDERIVAIRAADYFQLGGFMFDMLYPGGSLTYLGYETAGTVLDGKDVRIIAETSVKNHLGILAAAGSLDGVLIDPNAPLLLLRFLVNDQLAIGTKIPLEIRKMDIIDTANLALSSPRVDAGAITVSNVSSLQLVDALPLSSTSMRIVFSDTIVAAKVADFRFDPNLLNDSSSLERSGNSVIFRNLNTMEPGRKYLLNVAEAVTGNVSGKLSSAHNFAFFNGFPTERPSNIFRIESVDAISNTGVRIVFTEDINPESIETPDFVIPGISVIKAQKDPADPKAVLLTTSPQNSLSGSAWLLIQNVSEINDLRSARGELLSLNTATLLPFGIDPLGPKVINVTAQKTDTVLITFDQALLGSSITTDALKIFEEGRSTNLVSGPAFFDLSADHRTITLYQVKTSAGKTYRLHIAPGTLKSNSANQDPVELFGNIATFMGQGSFYTPWDFSLESAEALAADTVRINFSEEPHVAGLEIGAFEIWTRDAAENARKLLVTAFEKQGTSIILKTEAGQPGQSYFVLLDSNKIKSIFGEQLGIPNGRGFVGFQEGMMRVVSVAPREVPLGKSQEIVISGVHFPTTASVRVGSHWLEPDSITEREIKVLLPDDLLVDAYDIIIATAEGVESRLPDGIVVIDPEIETKLRPTVLSDESYASPLRVPNDGSTATTLWVRIDDPRGVSDIDKVTADLRQLDRSAAENFELESFVDNKAWYRLKITVPSTVPTSKEATEIPVTVENKTGFKAFGTVSVLISRDLESSIPPVIESATAAPDKVAPGDQTDVMFQLEVSDEDGASDVARVVLDASQVGLGIIVLATLSEIEKDRECIRSDYMLGDWGSCIGNVQRRAVELKSNIECIENTKITPVSERQCSASVCLRSDWVPAEWGPCSDGIQTRNYIKKPDSNCIGESDKPLPDKRNCTSVSNSPTIPTLNPTVTPPSASPSPTVWQRIFDTIFPRALARTVFGNKIWYQGGPFKIPDWVPLGTYKLPVTVIDREGTETTGTITISVIRDSVGTPNIDGDDVHIAPRYSMPNDGKSEFQIFAKATDPNGVDDIVSVSLNLSEIGLPPIAMAKGQVEGPGAWYASPKLTIPRTVIPGFRQLSVSVTDKDGNSYVKEFRFHVSTPDNSGDAPKINADRAYTNPRAFINNEKTQGTMYVFVEEGDAPIAHVTANLSTILRYTPQLPASAGGNNNDGASPSPGSTESPTPTATLQQPIPPPPPFSFLPATFFEKVYAQPAIPGPIADPGTATATPDANSPVNFDLPTTDDKPLVPVCLSTDTLACMFPSINEGSRGKWYYLPNLVVRKGVIPSQNPYFISVVATDAEGRKAEAEVPVFISDGIIPLTEYDLPYLVSAVATGTHEVQAFFSSSLDLSRIRKDAFSIAFFDDVNTKLPIKNIDIRSDGRVVTFATNPMNVGDRYTLFADADKLGLKQGQQTSNQVDFMGYTINNAGMFFELTSVTPTSANSLEVVFRKNLKFSSLLIDGSNFKIIEKGTGDILPVKRAQIGGDPRTVILSTGTQRAGVTYLLQAKDIVDYSGQKLKRGFGVILFRSFENTEEIIKLLNMADFNQDGKVDFLDFSIFSTVYGTTGTDVPDSDNADLNADGRVDFLDFTIFAQQYGQKLQEMSPSLTPTPTQTQYGTYIF